MRPIDADAHECWACVHHQNETGKCDTWCDAGEAFELREDVKNAPTIEVKPVVYCKDCIWWEDEHVLLSDGTTRPYTEEEKKNCPTGVTCDIGINVGSRCMINPHITNLFRNADDYCSRAMRKAGRKGEHHETD